MGFRGLLLYLLREGMEGREQEATLLGGNMSGRNARELTREFGVFGRLNPAVQLPVFHASLRLPADETLSDGQWQAAAADYLAGMGYTDTAYIVVKHPENHIHIAASRVRFDGSTVRAWQDRWRGQAVTEAIERRFGLSHPTRPTPPLGHDRMHPEEGTDRTEAGQRARTREILANRLEQAIAHSNGSRESFHQALSTLGVEARWNIAQTGRVNGAAFHLVDAQGHLQATMKGSAIGPAFAWPRLATRLAGRAGEHLATRGKAPGADLHPQRSGTTDTSRLSLMPAGVNRGQEGNPLPIGRRESLADHGLSLAQPVETLPARLVADARRALVQQERWNGHVDAATVLHQAAQRLGREHPEVGVTILVAALAAARPGSLTAFPGGAVALAAHLDAAQSARAQEKANVPGEERDYATR